MTANSFDELVIPMAEEAPHAVVLDWYRRLELMIRDYLMSRHFCYQNGPAAERIISADVCLGAYIASAVESMRRFRNQIAHENRTLSSNEAVAFSRTALDLIGRLWSAADAHAA